jgi:hypothetical protein
MMKTVIALTLVAFGLLYLNGRSNDEAMAKCQIEHSYDTCFSALNR